MSIKVGGISLKGMYHEINQDAYCCASSPIGQVVVLSDGVGSCKMSHFGSRALCESVLELAFEMLCDVKEPKEFLEKIQSRWLRKLRGMSIAECCCTALFVIIKGNHFTAFHLGDGVIVVRADDVSTVTLDYKEDDFCNYTDAMDEELYPEQWKIVKRDFNKLQGVYLSSDGVGLDRYTVFRYADFAEEFFKGYTSFSVEEIECKIETWLKDWDGNDDKTIVFALG